MKKIQTLLVGLLKQHPLVPCSVVFAYLFLCSYMGYFMAVSVYSTHSFFAPFVEKYPQLLVVLSSLVWIIKGLLHWLWFGLGAYYGSDVWGKSRAEEVLLLVSYGYFWVIIGDYSAVLYLYDELGSEFPLSFYIPKALLSGYAFGMLPFLLYLLVVLWYLNGKSWKRSLEILLALWAVHFLSFWAECLLL